MRKATAASFSKFSPSLKGLIRVVHSYHCPFYNPSDNRYYMYYLVKENDPKLVKKDPNPIFKPSEDPDAWDSDGLLTPQVFETGGYYYMLYAGLNGDGWDKGHCVSGLARMRKKK